MDSALVPMHIVSIVLCVTLLVLILRIGARITKAHTDLSTLGDANRLAVEQIRVEIGQILATKFGENAVRVEKLLQNHDTRHQADMSNLQKAVESRMGYLVEHITVVEGALKEYFKTFGEASCENQKEQLRILEAGPLAGLRVSVGDVNEGIKQLGEMNLNLKGLVLSGNEEVARKLGEAMEVQGKQIREVLDKIDEPIDI
jgi:hypothetical protein